MDSSSSEHGHDGEEDSTQQPFLQNEHDIIGESFYPSTELPTTEPAEFDQNQPTEPNFKEEIEELGFDEHEEVERSDIDLSHLSDGGNQQPHQQLYLFHEVDEYEGLPKIGVSKPSIEEYSNKIHVGGFVALDMDKIDRKAIKAHEKWCREVDVFEENNGLSVRAVFAGIFIGIVVCAVNVNFALRTGWTQGGSIFAAIISIAFFKIFEAPARARNVLYRRFAYNQWEATITTTVASSVGIMCAAAGLATCIPALKLLNFSFSYWELLIWSLSVGFFGIYFAYIFRKKVLVKDKLAFPTGTATAQTIKATIIVSHRESAVAFWKAMVLLIFGVLSAMWSFTTFLFPILEEPPVPMAMKNYTFTFYLNPMLYGGGMISGFRASSSLFFGSILGWGVLAPIVQNAGWVKGELQEMDGGRGWILWVGVTIMFGESIVQLFYTLLYALNMILKSIRDYTNRNGPQVMKTKEEEREEQKIEEKKKESQKYHVPWYVLVLGMIVSSILTVLVGQFYFKIQWYFCLAAIPLSCVLSIIAIRCAGETDINPVGVLGKVTQLIFAGIAPGMVSTNIMAAGIIAAGAAGSGDFMQDLKIGYLTRVGPRKQFIAQVIGVVVGCFVATGIYMVYSSAYNIGVDSDVPAPAAHAWKAVAVLLTDGLVGIPTSSKIAMAVGLIFGIFMSSLRQLALSIPRYGPRIEPFFPSTLAFGLGMLVPAKMCVTMMCGAVSIKIWEFVCWIAKMRNGGEENEVSKSAKNYTFSVSSGLMTGEGLMGIFVAVLRLLGVKSVVEKVFF